VILTRRNGGNFEVRTGFALTDMVQWGYQGLRNIRPQVGEREARGIPALHRAARLRAEQVASLGLYCWRGDGPTRERIDTVWQARLFKNGPQPNQTNPVQTKFSFWETIEESLAWRNNAYIWKNTDPSTRRITDWWALHPDQVSPHYDRKTRQVMFTVQVAAAYVDPVGRGPGTYEKDGGTILHIRGHGQGGALFAPSPLEVFREALQGPIGRQRHEARMWRRGTALQVAIEFPQGVSEQQADQWRERWRANYEGTEGETTAVIGGGAVVKPIGMSMADAQFAEMADLTVQDASRIMAVPANLLGVQVVKVRSNLEDDLAAWLRFGLGPELERIEDALYADPDLFGGSQTQPGFDTSGFVRGDLQTEALILQGFVQAGVITPNEARHELGYEKDMDPNSDTLQTTPVGGAENPGLKLKPLAAPTPEGDM
jgi:HK97 family phage portal protein